MDKQQVRALNGLNMHRGVPISIDQKLMLKRIGVITKADDTLTTQDRIDQRMSLLPFGEGDTLQRWEREGRWMHDFKGGVVDITFVERPSRMFFARCVKKYSDWNERNCSLSRKERNSP